MAPPVLHDISVLDLSVYLPGSYASLLLADLGAEVVKVERPPSGEVTREWEPQLHGEGCRFLQRNRNKKSICLDLTSDTGVEVFYDLVSSADVVIEGFRPGTLNRLEAGYEDVKAVDPDIIYCSITGYGQDGPRANQSGHDLNYISTTGILGATRADNRPVIPGIPIGDFASGLFAAFSILAALQSRDEHGGQHIDISITDILFSWLIAHAGEHFCADGKYDPSQALTSGGYACYNVYATADGKHLAVGAVEYEFWERFCELIEREDLIDDHLDEKERDWRQKEVQQTLVTRSRSEWMDIFKGEDVPITCVNSLNEALSSPHIRERDMVKTIDFNGTDLKQIRSPFGFSEFTASMDQAPPRLGEDNASVLHSLGYDQSHINDVIKGSIIR